ncbi:30S ribosomal protein S5 [Patescibacteria group bacterium]|nr:30S ribosomal protein S5 [Patescibacteria group bacterium]
MIDQKGTKTSYNAPEKEQKEFDEKVVQVSRVSKKTKGGNKMGFSILMVVGDRKGRVGVGLGKSNDVQSAIRKGVKKAKKKMITVPLDGTTIPFSVVVKRGAGKVLLKPAPKGSGVIAGGPVRAVVEAAGIRDISTKILGSGNQSVSVYATFEALNRIQKLVAIKGIKLKSIVEVEREEAKKLRELSEKAAAKAEAHDQEAQETKKAEKAAKPEKKAPAKKVSSKAAPKKAEAKPAKAEEKKSEEK